ncbi:putative nuclease HARBI1 [Rhizophagus clarus]|uniref:Putative nuclease HARBI1 n=1 Tax=Rhizophagus clarus TaxID=94130 RepID=A0A8H3LWB5_9GLOM|nr:putative nuclease HARBI1 [Rhizophagus clarus]
MKAIRNIKLEFVQWPKNNNRATVHAGFQAIRGFQNVIGAIDGTHFILNEVPAQDPTAFFTRKKRYVIHCQGIVDFKGIFINYIIGWPESVHDARVYANSDFFLNKAKYIEGDDYVLGDSAYPISPFLIIPFKNPSNHRQRQFNFIHSKHRVVVENAFGRLKARFKALKELSVKDEITDQNDDDDDNNRYDWEDESDEILKLKGELKRERMLNQFVA